MPTSTPNQSDQSPDPWADVLGSLTQDKPELSGTPAPEDTPIIGSLDQVRVELGELSLSDALQNANEPVPPTELIGLSPEQDEHTHRSLAALKAAGLHPKSIYYPASETYVTIAQVFPEARVIFGEVEQRAVEALRDGGYEVLLGDMHTISLPNDEPVNLVYMRYMPAYKILGENKLRELLVPGGYFVTDNEFGQADLLRNSYGSFTELRLPEQSDVPAVEKLYLFQLHQD